MMPLAEPTLAAHARTLSVPAHLPRRRLRVARTVTATRDVHLRVAAHVVQLSSRFEAKLMLVKGRHRVDGKSILGVLMLGAVRGTRLRLVAIGRDAEAAISAIARLFTAT